MEEFRLLSELFGWMDDPFKFLFHLAVRRHCLVITRLWELVWDMGSGSGSRFGLGLGCNCLVQKALGTGMNFYELEAVMIAVYEMVMR
jgi:hypothetical protein